MKAEPINRPSKTRELLSSVGVENGLLKVTSLEFGSTGATSGVGDGVALVTNGATVEDFVFVDERVEEVIGIDKEVVLEVTERVLVVAEEYLALLLEGGGVETQFEH